MVLGLALAQAAAIRRVSGRGPVLIFDEACAHLDAARREGLAQTVLDLSVQAFMTGVEPVLFDAFGAGAQRVEVREGAARLLD